MCILAGPAGSGFSTLQHDHLFLFFRRHRGFLRGAAGGDGDLVEIDVDRVQSDLRTRLEQAEG